MSEIIVYSTKWCPACIVVKKYLKSKDIDFKSIDVGEDEAARKEMLSLTGRLEVPVTRNGSILYHGFNTRKLDKLARGEEID
jgi:glutaredoxin